MDPNEVRYRQARAQHASGSPPHSANSPGETATVNPSHGGNMDPNETRLRQARMQQASAPSSPPANSPQTNNAFAPQHGTQMGQTQMQPAQHGSSSYLINMPNSSPSGSNNHQSSQSPQSPHSGQYFPTQYGNHSPYPGQGQQAAQSPQLGGPTQVGCGHPLNQDWADISRRTQTTRRRIFHFKVLQRLRMIRDPSMDHLKYGRSLHPQRRSQRSAACTSL